MAHVVWANWASSNVITSVACGDEHLVAAKSHRYLAHVHISCVAYVGLHVKSRSTAGSVS